MRAALALLLIVAPLAEAAPIPPPKAKAPLDLSGSWVMLWSGAEWPTVLMPDGVYIAERPGGPRYEGQWRLVGNRLQIEERVVGPTGTGQYYRYSFTLRAGELGSACGGLRLVRVR